MHNPFLLQNFKAQGFSHILFADTDQKKAYNDAEISLKAEIRKSADSLQSNKPLPMPTHIPSPAEQYKNTAPNFETRQEAAANPFQKNDFASLAAQKAPANPKKQAAQSLRPLNPLQENALPVENWNIQWKETAKRCSLPFLRPQNLSRQIVWTYKGLEEDLFTANPSDKRRQILAQIIKTLSFPKGTHIFLPYRLIAENGQSELAVMQGQGKTYSFFWSAINHIRPRVLIVFGEDARQELNLPPMLPTQKHTIMPVTVFALDSIMLYAENAQENTIMMNFLVSNLRAFA